MKNAPSREETKAGCETNRSVASEACELTKMLVAYEACGCRVMALLDATDPGDDRRFREEAYEKRLVVREERHERIGAQRCAVHAMEELSASRS
jgi:hypothetical protein